MDDRNNTIAGWVLGAGIVALGGWLVTGEVFKNGEVAQKFVGLRKEADFKQALEAV